MTKNLDAKTLYELNAKYHRHCYSSVTNAKMLERSKERFRKATEYEETEKIIPTRGRPRKRTMHGEASGVSTKLLRSGCTTYDKNLCIICQRIINLSCIKYQA